MCVRTLFALPAQNNAKNINSGPSLAEGGVQSALANSPASPPAPASTNGRPVTPSASAAPGTDVSTRGPSPTDVTYTCRTAPGVGAEADAGVVEGSSAAGRAPEDSKARASVARAGEETKEELRVEKRVGRIGVSFIFNSDSYVCRSY